MKIPTPCATSFLEAVEREKTEGIKMSLVLLPGRMTDDGYIIVKCSKGHETVVVYDERKFELLFQSACQAFIDGYEREAVQRQL